MRSNIVRGIVASLALALAFPAFALAQKEIVIWHSYRGAEKTAYSSAKLRQP